MKREERKTDQGSLSSSHRLPGSIFPTRLLVASRNRGKVSEIRQLLATLRVELRDLTRLAALPDIEETGTTFAANALQKARYYRQQSGLVTLADDSGLEVDALGGAPGVRSARYAGPNATDEQRMAKLLEALQGIPPDRRTARFVCVVALVGPDDLELTFSGLCRGFISERPLGRGGFGFDPVFQYPPLGQTFAQLTEANKSSVSHRGQALRRLRQFLIDWQNANCRNDEAGLSV